MKEQGWCESQSLGETGCGEVPDIKATASSLYSVSHRSYDLKHVCNRHEIVRPTARMGTMGHLRRGNQDDQSSQRVMKTYTLACRTQTQQSQSSPRRGSKPMDTRTVCWDDGGREGERQRTSKVDTGGMFVFIVRSRRVYFGIWYSFKKEKGYEVA